MDLAHSSPLTTLPPCYTPVAIDVKLAATASNIVATVPVRIVGISKGVLIIRSSEARVADSEVEVLLSKRPLTGMVRGCAPDDEGFILVVEVPEHSA
jgi:hypothetical protein